MSKKSNRQPSWKADRRAARARKFEQQNAAAIAFNEAFAGIVTGDAYDAIPCRKSSSNSKKTR